MHPHYTLVKRLGILTRDFRVLHELVRRLNSRGVIYRVLDIGDPVPPDVGAIVTSWRDFVQRQDRQGHQRTLDGDKAQTLTVPRDVPVVAVALGSDEHEDYDRAISEAMKALSGIEEYKELVIGIDPGDHPGIAFIGDGVVVHTGHVPEAGGVLPHIKQFLGAFPADRVVIRVGHGARLHRNRILNDVMDLAMEDIEVEVADETGTNPTMIRRPSMHVTRDIQAAIGIGLTPGRKIRRKVRLDVLPGEVAEIQRKSRIRSEGELTVNRDLAGQVARGELTMDQAIQRQRATKEEAEDAA